MAVLRLAKIQRNLVNGLIYKAKNNYIVNSLNLNVNKPKRVWRIIKDMVDDEDAVDITSFIFRDLITNNVVDRNNVPDFFNDYFVEIADRTRERPNNIMNEYVECYENVMSAFDFIPPVLEDIYGYQYGFLPGRSTQEAVFNTVRHMFSCIKQNKIMGGIFLNVAKAFNYIDHEVLFFFKWKMWVCRLEL